jgi:RND family efflux transporter MFP subunit
MPRLLRAVSATIRRPSAARSSALLAALLTLTALAAACGGSAPAGAAAPGGPGGGQGGVPVEAVTLAESPIEQVGEFVSTIKSRNSVTVQPQVEGFITKIAVKSGDRVSPGTVLFDIDATPQQAVLANLESLRAAREAETNLAQQQAKRAKTLLDVGATSQQEHEQSVAAQAASEAQLKAVDEQIKQQRAELAYYRVVAPAQGIIGDVPVRQGDRVTKATLLTTIDDNTGLEVYINVPVQQAPNLKVGLPVRLVNDAGDVLSTEKVSFVSQSVDDTNQTVLAKAQLSGAKAGTFRTEQFVRAQLVFSTAPGLRVPVVAALRINGSYFVFVVEADKGMNVARQKAIKVGPVIGNEYTVLSGLAAGNQVIVSGIQKLGDGAPVTVMPAAAPKQEGR